MEAPTPNVWNTERHDKMEKWAQKNKIPFLDTNMILDEIGIDWETDTEDAGKHLNINGAQKLSKYIGRYLSNYYKFTDHRNDSKYEQWHEEAKEYEKYVKNTRILENNIKEKNENLKADAEKTQLYKKK